MMVPMPAAIVLIVCKTVISGPPDQNAGFTKAENREWATEHAMMVCRRQEVQMYDMAESRGRRSSTLQRPALPALGHDARTAMGRAA